LFGSLRNLRQVDIGFRKDHVLLISIRPGLSNYTSERAGRLYRELCRRFNALPGVTSVTLSMDTPLGGVSYTAGASAPGQPQSTKIEASLNAIGSRFFETMGIPLLAGRDLNPRDEELEAPVAIVSENVARILFPNQNPLGGHIKIGNSLLEIVGVVKETRYNGLREPATPMVYRPYSQMPEFWEELFFGIRTTSDPASLVTEVRRELHEAASDVPVFSLSTLDDRVSAGLVREHMVSTLSTWFGAFALLLASIGVYGTLSYSVAERRREIGIRHALGAGNRAIIWTILRQVFKVTFGGIVLGLPAALAAARLLKSLLYGVTSFEPSILIVVVAILAVAILAGYLPARRASRIDPMVALRQG
jgi:predicted permease